MSIANQSADATEFERALAAGRAAESRGDLREAIGEYGAALRQKPDTDLAHRLLKLRHDIVRRSTWPKGREAWPPALRDPFPDVEGIPEVGPAVLDTATLGGAILHHGALIVRSLYPEAQAIALRDRAIRSIEARDRIRDGNPEPDDHRWHRAFDAQRKGTNRERLWVQEAGGMLTADAPLVTCELLDLVRDSGLIGAIAGYFAEPPVISFHKSVLRRVVRSLPTWHQDGSFMGGEVRTIDLWLALSDCGGGTDATGLDLVPRRFEHFLETQTHGATFQDSIGDGLVQIEAPDTPWVAPRFAPGDAVLFDERFVHRTGVGEGYTRERLAVEMWFFAPSEFPEGYIPILA